MYSKVHGGALAAFLDVAMGFLIWWAPGTRHVATGELTVRYRRPIPLNTTVYVEAAVDRIEGRKRFLTASLSAITDTGSNVASQLNGSDMTIDSATNFVRGGSVYFQLDTDPAKEKTKSKDLGLGKLPSKL